MIRLQTFSVPDLRDADGQELRSILTRSKRFALLVYLATENHVRFHRRDSLLPLFWPDLDEPRARHALNQALHVLRGGLGEGVIENRGDEEIGVNPDSFWCDAAAFDFLLREGDREAALDLHVGEFLPGFSVRGAPDFMDWVERKRDRLQRRASEAAADLSKDQETSGKITAAVSWARRALDLAPLDERLVRELVRLLELAGRGADAVAAFDDFSATLEEELGLEPSPETLALVAAVRERLGTAASGDLAKNQREAKVAALSSRPYKFLNHFEEADAPIFFGRGQEARTFLSKIHANRLNLLFGQSGSGKTSLLQAGLVPLLRADGYVPVYVRIHDDPLGEIRRRVSEEVGEVARSLDPGLPLEDYLKQVAQRVDQPLVILLDQFEELFVRFDGTFRRNFAQSFHRCLTALGHGVRFVVSLRDEYLARLWEFREQIPNVLYNGLRLETLPGEAARDAIVEPARLFGIDVEEELVSRLVQDLSVGGIEPPQLQIVCDTMYDALGTGEKAIRLCQYKALGEARQILSSYLERVLEALPAKERRLTKETLKALVTSEETRDAARVEDVVRMVGSDPEPVERILRDLSHRRLVRRVPVEEGPRYELTHEYLVEEIRGWLSEKEREVKEVRELLGQALRNHRRLGLLMPPAQVRLVRDKRLDLDLSPEDGRLLKLSDRARVVRKRKIYAGVAASIFMAILTILGGRYWYLTNHQFVRVWEWNTTRIRGSALFSFADAEETRSREYLKLYAGSPRSWVVDGWFGFPKDLGELDFHLLWMDPEEWEGFRVGVSIPGDSDVETEMLVRMLPEKRVARLAMTGRIQGALPEALALYDSAGSEMDVKLDTLSWLLGLSGVSDSAFVTTAVEHGLRHTGANLSPRFTASNRPLGVMELLANTTPTQRSNILGPYQGQQTQSGLNSLWLATTLQMPEAREAALEFLDSDDWALRGYGLAALLHQGDCGDLPALTEVAFSDPDLYRGNQELLNYLTQCQAYDPILTLFRGTVGVDLKFQRDVFRSLHAIDPERAVAQVGVLLEPLPPYAVGFPEETTLLDGVQGSSEGGAMAFVLDRLQHPDPAVRAGAAAMLAEWGRSEALGPVLEAVLDEGLDRGSRDRAMRALRWFSGPPIVFLIDSLLASGQPAWHRASLFGAISSQSPDIAAPRLIDGMADHRWEVRERAKDAALSSSLDLQVPVLEAALPDVAEDTRLSVYHVLQARTGQSFHEVFREFLERPRDEPVDAYRVQEAMLGLMEAYRLSPASEPLDALRSPSHNVRAAAMMALSDHPDRAEMVSILDAIAQDTSDERRTHAQLALWVLGLMDKAKGTLELGYEAVARGQTMVADLHRYRANEPTISPFSPGMALAVFLVGWVVMEPPGFTEIHQELFFSRYLAEGHSMAVERGSQPSAPVDPTPLDGLAGYIDSHPHRVAGILENPYFQRLREFYAFRVLTGLQPPLRIEELPAPFRSDGER